MEKKMLSCLARESIQFHVQALIDNHHRCKYVGRYVAPTVTPTYMINREDVCAC